MSLIMTVSSIGISAGSMTLIMALKTLVLWSISFFPPTSSYSIKLLRNGTAKVSQTTTLWHPPCLCMDWNASPYPHLAGGLWTHLAESNSDGPILGSLSWQGSACMQACTAICPRDAESRVSSAWLWALHPWHAPLHVCWKNAQFFISPQMDKFWSPGQLLEHFWLLIWHLSEIFFFFLFSVCEFHLLF